MNLFPESIQHEASTAVQNNVRSEVGAFIEQVELEMQAAVRGLSGMAITARHDFIVARVGNCIDESKVDTLMQALREQQHPAASSDPTK